MREIKIKVKRKMLDLYDRYVETRWEIFTIEEGIMDIDNCLMDTAGQYTGLVDKNGVEIYEGDICKYDYDELIHVKYDLSKQGVVKFEQCAFRFELDCGLWIVLTLGEELEIIGNIHNDK